MDGPDTPNSRRRWEACLELKQPAKSEGTIKVKELPASTVASVTFDPDKVASRLVYHGLGGWLEWREKDKELRGLGSTREVYLGNPWTDARAWAKTEVQVIVEKMK